MPNFKFRMEPLLRIRENERKERQADLAKAYHAETILQGHMETNLKEQEQLLDSGRKSAGAGEINVDHLLELRRYQAVLLAEHRGMSEKMKLVQEEIERRRELLVEANREVQVLEKLRNRQFERFQDELRKKESKEMDEVAGRSFYKKSF